MLAQLASVVAQFPPLPNPGNGPDSLQKLLGVFMALMGLGFVFGIAGHLTKIKTLVAAGALMIFVATALFLVAVAQHG